MSHTMRVTIAGHLIGATTPQAVADQIAGANEVLVPGVTDWANVSHTTPKGGDDLTAIVVAAVITTEEQVSGGDYDGQIVTTEFVRQYIIGAGDYFASVAGDMFSPTTVSVIQIG